LVFKEKNRKTKRNRKKEEIEQTQKKDSAWICCCTRPY